LVLPAGRVIFAGAPHPSIDRLVSFLPSVFGTIGISRGSRSCQPFEGVPLSCGFQPRKWSNGNAAGSPFSEPHNVQFYFFLFFWLSLLAFISLPLAFLHSFFLSIGLSPTAPRFAAIVLSSSTSCVYSAHRVQRGGLTRIHISKSFYMNCILYRF